MKEGFIPKHGGYKSLLSYKKAEIIFDATNHFCNRYINVRSRTHDQMVQAARSGKQNILEGSMASGTSKEMEIKLTGVARASLEELLADYQDFLRVKKLTIWDKNSPESLETRRLGSTEGVTYSHFEKLVETGNAETAANTIICLINQATYLLDHQLHKQEQEFLKTGGIKERMTKARWNTRNKTGE